MFCWQMVRFLIQLRPSMYFDVSLISLQIQSMVHVAWSKMLKVHELYYLTWESVVWRGMFCQLVFGWWFCTPICKSTWTYSHDVIFFFLWRRKMMCFQFDGFVCDKTSQDFAKVHSLVRASWLQPIHENQMGVHPYFENK